MKKTKKQVKESILRKIAKPVLLTVVNKLPLTTQMLMPLKDIIVEERSISEDVLMKLLKGSSALTLNAKSFMDLKVHSTST